MTLNEIVQAVESGKTVHWKNDNYTVVPSGYANTDGSKAYDILSKQNFNRIGLTWTDGITMNENPEDFYIGDQ